MECSIEVLTSEGISTNGAFSHTFLGNFLVVSDSNTIDLLLTGLSLFIVVLLPKLIVGF